MPGVSRHRLSGASVLAELLTLDVAAVAAGVLARQDIVQLEKTAVDAGMLSRWYWACQAVESGITSAAEVRRVLGFRDACASRPD